MGEESSPFVHNEDDDDERGREGSGDEDEEIRREKETYAAFDLIPTSK
jgi:hypothetical protein